MGPRTGSRLDELDAVAERVVHERAVDTRDGIVRCCLGTHGVKTLDEGGQIPAMVAEVARSKSIAVALRHWSNPELADWRLVFIGYACVWGTAIMVSPVPYPLPNDLLWLLAGLLLRHHLVASPVSSPAATAPPQAPSR